MSSDLSVHASTCLVSLGCKAALSTLPPELLSRIGSHLSLHEYSFLSRTCSRLHQLLFHPAEVVYFLKVRYRFSNESGSIIIFAYLANMLARAPLVLERIFDDFFADSVLHLLEEQQRRRQRQAQRQRLNEGTYQLSQSIAMSAGVKSSNCSGDTIAIQRLESLEQHKDAEAARRQAKWEAIRMLGVLYALDKTHVGPSSSSNALVLCGATDVVEPTRQATNVTPASLSASASISAPTPCVPSTPLEPISTSIYPPRQLYTRGQSQAPSLCRERRSLRIHDPYDPNFTGKRGDSTLTLDGQHSEPEAWLAPLDLDPLHCFRPRRGMRKRHSATTDGSLTTSPSSAPASDSPPFSCSFSSQSRRLLPAYCTVLSPSSSNHVHSSGSTPNDQWAAQDVSGNTDWSSDTEDQATLTSRRSIKRATRSRLLVGRFHVRATSATESVGQYQEGRTHPMLNAIQCSGRFQPASVETKAPMPEPVKANMTLECKRGELMDENLDMSADRVKEQTLQQPVQPLQHRRYQIPNRVDKIAFLTKYTDRMHLKLQALEIKDWGQADIQRKKTYQLMIQHNDKTGEKDLVNFYLGRYGGSVQLQDDSQDQELQQQPTITAVAAG